MYSSMILRVIIIWVVVACLCSCSRPRRELGDTFDILQNPIPAITANGNICEFAVVGMRYTEIYDTGYRFLSPAFSPDQRYLLTTHRYLENATLSFEIADGDLEIFLVDLMSGERTQLTDNAHDDFAPAWSPDGSWIGYSADGENLSDAFSLWRMRPDGSQAERLTYERAYPFSWSPTGEEIIFMVREQALVSISVEDQARRTVLEGVTASGDEIAWSPMDNS